MLRSRLVTLGSTAVLAVVLTSRIGNAQSTAPDTDAIARTIITQSLGITEGEKVLILGPVREMQLLEDLAFQVRNVGAFPLLTITSDRLMERGSTEVPARFDSQTDSLQLALMDVIDAWVVVEPDTDPELLKNVPPERFAAQNEALQQTFRRSRERGIRFLQIGNSLAPTEWRAENAGMSQEALSAMFWDWVRVDYTELERIGQAVRDRLERGREVRVTHPNGTDLRFQIGGPAFVNDGVISDEDRQRGGAAILAWIPAGEAYTSAAPGSADGVIVAPQVSYLDDPSASSDIRNLRIKFRGGKVVSMTGEGPGFASYRALYEAAGEGAEEFGILDIGLNPSIRLPEDSGLGSFLPAGSVTLGFGNDAWAGGNNDVAWGDAHFMTGATVVVDGKALVQDGRLTP